MLYVSLIAHLPLPDNMDTTPTTGSSSSHDGRYNSDSRGDVVVGVAALFIVLSVLFAGLRAWARRIQNSSLIWGDIYVSLALGFIIAICGATIGKSMFTMDEIVF
jgi:hypothetical protein